jgi:hypothetical protein
MKDDLITKYAGKLVLPLLTVLSAAIASGANILFLSPLEKAGQGKLVLQIGTYLLGLLLLSVFYIIYLYVFKIRAKTRIQRDFIFNEQIGHYSHKKTGQLFCGCCLLENIDSPLITLEHSWFCQRKGCHKEYPNPEKPRPTQPSRKVYSEGVESWVTRRTRW